MKLSSEGVVISGDHESLVKYAGFGSELVKAKKKETIDQEPVDVENNGEVHLWLFEVPIATEGPDKGKHLEGICYYDKIPQAWKDEWKDKEITRADWAFDDPEDNPPEFRDFLNSHIPRFDDLIPYKKFWLYLEQARRWLQDKRDLGDVYLEDPYSIPDWKQRELGRIADNKLYGLNKYVTIREDGFAGGRRKYEASTPQALLAFLFDLGKCFDLVKGRQAAITSTMLAMAALEAVVRAAFSGLFMVHKKDGTGKALFRDKFQSTFQHLPQWMIGAVDVSKGFSAESAIMDFDPGDTKATKGRDISEMRLLSAEDSMTANGRTPTRSFFDEAQNIPTYQTVKAEIDPTMYQYNIATGKYKMVRSAYGWGTGSSNNTGNGAFENDFKGLLEAFQGGEDTGGWVPVFMNWTCRPGMTREFYDKQKQKYLRGQTEETKGLTATERLGLFCAHYPSKPDDAFMTSHKTLVPMEMIIKQQNRIINLCHKKGMAPTFGKFVPVFNESIKIPDGGMYPHPVVDVRWVELPADEAEAPIRMFIPPERNWINRYFQGTDPIQNDGGFSRFSSAIWDAAGRVEGTGDDMITIPTVACMLNARSQFPADLFEQNVLMGMYYRNHGQRACKELVEINVGHRYTDFKRGPVFNLFEALLLRTQLPPKYRGGTHIVGADLKGGKGSRKEALYGDLTDLLRSNWQNIWYYDFWSQVRHISVESRPDGSVIWGTQNKNVYNDDMVYAVAYAELCCRSLGEQPKYISAEAKEYTVKRVIRRRPGTNMPYYENEKTEVKYA